MKKPLITIVRVIVILASIGVTLYATRSLTALGFLIAGNIFKNFFSAKIYDPIFQDQSAQSWAISGIKKWATRRRPKLKFDI
jgi:hypothetical protein